MNLDLTLPNTQAAPVPLLHPTDTQDEYTLRIDNSSMDIIKSCPREALFYLLHRRGRPTSPAQNMGSAVHKALEFLYLHGFDESNLTTAYSLIDQHYVNKPITDEWRTPTFAQQVIQKYYERWKGLDPWTILTHDGMPFVERPFEIEVGELDVDNHLPFPPKQLLPPGFVLESNQQEASTLFVKKLHLVLIGKIDLAVNLNGDDFAVDHKTASRLGDTFWAKWPIAPQMKTYCWAFSKIFNRHPRGAIINVLVVRRPTRTGVSLDFQRQPYDYNPEILAEWETNTLQSLSNFVANAVDNTFPPNDSNCIRIYGKCPYFDVCVLPPAQRLHLLYTSEYAPVTWDPTNES